MVLHSWKNQDSSSFVSSLLQLSTIWAKTQKQMFWLASIFHNSSSIAKSANISFL